MGTSEIVQLNPFAQNRLVKGEVVWFGEYNLCTEDTIVEKMIEEQREGYLSNYS